MNYASKMFLDHRKMVCVVTAKSCFYVFEHITHGSVCKRQWGCVHVWHHSLGPSESFINMQSHKTPVS